MVTLSLVTLKKMLLKPIYGVMSGRSSGTRVEVSGLRLLS